MSFINVKNKSGTGSIDPPEDYDSWLDYWEKKKGKKATTCEAMSCIGSPNVGGHVVKVGGIGKVYILPLCYDHNNKSPDEVYQAWENDLVPVE